MNLTIPALVSGMPSLGTCSTVIAKLQEVLNDPRCSLGLVGQMIEKDPDLTARLLRLGNSAFFGFSHRVETVSETISLIGVQQVQDLITVTAVVDLFDGISADLISMRSFLKQSQACGIAARCMAVTRRMPKPEKFFVAGLLHDVGRLVLLRKAPDMARAIFEKAADGKLSLRESEHQLLGFDHAQLGEELLRVWNFPGYLTETVAFHHQPMLSAAYQLEASVVHVADVVVHGMEVGGSGETGIPALNARAWERLGLPTFALESIIHAVDEQLEEVESAFLRPDAPVSA